MRPLKLRLALSLQAVMPRFEPLERSTAELLQAVREVQDSIGRLAGQHEGTWGQVQDVEVRAAFDRTEIAALRRETADLARGWLQSRTGLKRLERRDRPVGRTLYVSRDGSLRGGAVSVRPGEDDAAGPVGDVGALPFAPGSFDAIIVSGPPPGAEPALLEHWHALLRPAGALTFVKGAT